MPTASRSRRSNRPPISIYEAMRSVFGPQPGALDPMFRNPHAQQADFEPSVLDQYQAAYGPMLPQGAPYQPQAPPFGAPGPGQIPAPGVPGGGGGSPTAAELWSQPQQAGFPFPPQAPRFSGLAPSPSPFIPMATSRLPSPMPQGPAPSGPGGFEDNYQRRLAAVNKLGAELAAMRASQPAPPTGGPMPAGAGLAGPPDRTRFPFPGAVQPSQPSAPPASPPSSLAPGMPFAFERQAEPSQSSLYAGTLPAAMGQGVDLSPSKWQGMTPGARRTVANALVGSFRAKEAGTFEADDLVDRAIAGESPMERMRTQGTPMQKARLNRYAWQPDISGPSPAAQAMLAQQRAAAAPAPFDEGRADAIKERIATARAAGTGTPLTSSDPIKAQEAAEMRQQYARYRNAPDHIQKLAARNMVFANARRRSARRKQRLGQPPMFSGPMGRAMAMATSGNPRAVQAGLAMMKMQQEGGQFNAKQQMALQQMAMQYGLDRARLDQTGQLGRAGLEAPMMRAQTERDALGHAKEQARGFPSYKEVNTGRIEAGQPLIPPQTYMRERQRWEQAQGQGAGAGPLGDPNLGVRAEDVTSRTVAVDEYVSQNAQKKASLDAAVAAQNWNAVAKALRDSNVPRDLGDEYIRDVSGDPFATMADGVVGLGGPTAGQANAWRERRRREHRRLGRSGSPDLSHPYFRPVPGPYGVLHRQR